MSVIIPIHLDLKSAANIRSNWRVKSKLDRVHRTTARMRTNIKAKEISELKQPLTIRLVRHSPRKLDSDNLQYAFKSLRDGVADAVWPELSHAKRDSHENVVWEYGQQKNKLKYITIEIYSEK